MSSTSVNVMMSGTADPRVETKKVVWRPDTAATVIKVGQPVCYDSDCTHDAQERATTPISGGTAYAEGNQSYIGRLFTVEEPQTDNLHAFAGIVTALGPLAGADGDLIQIAVPKDGSVVPVYTNLNCLAEQTIMGIRNGEADVSYPVVGTGRAIGVAMEDVDRGTGSSDGLCWMKFKSFLFDNQNEALSVDDEANASNVVANAINVTTLQTTGRFTALDIKAAATAGGGCHAWMYGLGLNVEATVSATTVLHVVGAGFTLNITGGTPTEYDTVCKMELYSDANATLSSISRLSVLHLTHQVTNAPQANRFGWILLTQNGAQASDAMILATNLATLPAVAMTGDRTIGSTKGDYAIKVYLQSQPGTQQWYIPLIKGLGA